MLQHLIFKLNKLNNILGNIYEKDIVVVKLSFTIFHLY